MQCNLFIDHIFVLPPDTIQAGTAINGLGAPKLATGLSIYIHQEQNVAPLRIDSKRSKWKNLLACVFHSPCPSDAWTSNDRGALIAAPAIWWTRKDVKLRCQPPCTGLCEEVALPKTHRGWSEFRNWNLKFNVGRQSPKQSTERLLSGFCLTCKRPLQVILWYSLAILCNVCFKIWKGGCSIDWTRRESCALKFLDVSVHEFACTKSCHSLWCPVQESKWGACWTAESSMDTMPCWMTCFLILNDAWKWT